MSDYDLTYLSFGAGVQSTALLAMCVLGESGFPRPDVVVHARTQSELADTDRHLEFMCAWCAERGVQVLLPTAGSLEDAQLGLVPPRANGFTVSIPAFTESGGMLRRQCTRHHRERIAPATRPTAACPFGSSRRGDGRRRPCGSIGETGE